MKKYITASLFIFWAVVVAIITAGLISINKNQSTIIGSNIADINQTSKITGINSNVATLTLSMDELAKHNSSRSCWLLISGKIYDVTTFLTQHPGGEGNILSNCGTDATTAFNTKGRQNGSPHSSNANALLTNYFIGNLNKTITTTPTNTTSPNPPAPNPIIPRGGGDDENDD
jgi:cytochrome b involved in lipid metabolism